MPRSESPWLKSGDPQIGIGMGDGFDRSASIRFFCLEKSETEMNSSVWETADPLFFPQETLQIPAGLQLNAQSRSCHFSKQF